jgi:hypothetical protein
MQDPRTESVLTALGVQFEYIPEFPMAELISDPSTQVRREENRAPKPEVERYHKLMKAGAEFPPIVITGTGAVIDGNTRQGAAVKMRRTTFPVYQCDTTAAAVAKLIGVELNAVHGKRMEKAELAEWLASGNGSVSADDAERLTGWSARTVQRVREALKFNVRKDKLGIHLVTVLPEAVREALMKITNPECFRALSLLADEAGLTATEINSIVKEINELSLIDPDTALAKIHELRHDRQQQIDERRAGLRVSTPMYRQIALHLGWVIKQGPSGLHDANPHTSAKSQRYLEEAQTVIKEALARYEA